MQRFLAIIIILAVVSVTVGCLGRSPKQSGVFVTNDSGGSWNASPDLQNPKQKRPKQYPPLEVTAIAVSPHDSKTVVAGTPKELYMTTDSGSSWQKLTEKLPVANQKIAVQSIRFHPTQTATFYVTGVSSGYGKVFKSSDNGGSLQDIFTVSRPGQTVTSIAIDPTNPDVLFVGDQLGALYSSRDGGASWRRNFTTNQIISTVTISGNAIFVGTVGSGVWRSTDGGSTFAPATGGLTGTGSTVWALLPAFGGLYAGTDAGLFVTRDFGATWQNISNPLPRDTRVQALAASGNNLYFAANAVIYRATPDGQPFTPTQLKLARNVFGLSASPDGSTVYAGASNSSANYADRFGYGLTNLRLGNS